MSLLDFVVLIGSMLAIAAYGIWRTRRPQNLNDYVKGDPNLGWATIGISVMATQASAITFISTPGQGYFVYTSLSWFRQLPAGVPGAYRLFANLLSLGK